jgi:hypothetical protein
MTWIFFRPGLQNNPFSSTTSFCRQAWDILLAFFHSRLGEGSKLTYRPRSNTKPINAKNKTGMNLYSDEVNHEDKR